MTVTDTSTTSESPTREPLPANASASDASRGGSGPLGALPALSGVARRALTALGALAVLNTAALIAQAFLLASVLASIVAGDTGALAVPLGVLTAVVLARALISWVTRAVSARAAAGTQEELRAKAVRHALRLGPEWIVERGSARLATLSTRGLNALDSYFTEYLPALVAAAIVPVGAGAAILLADWPSAVIIACTLPLLPMFAILIGKYTADRVSRATDAVHRMSEHLLELVRALPVLTAFGRAGVQAGAVRRVSDRHRQANLGTMRVAFSSAFVLELFAMLAVALVAVVIGIRLASGDLGLAVGLGVLILAPECYQPIRTLGAAFHASEDGVEAIRRVDELLAEPLPAEGAVRPERGELRVRELRVARRGGWAPDGESFTVRTGERYWLNSPSGAGKSTMLAVLLGFVRPSSGTVTVGNTPLEDVDMSTWRGSVAWVPQSPAFSGGTVRHELAEAAPNADVVEVLSELDLTGLADKPVGTLSAGQRQRVAVARALLKIRAGAWLLLADEPTAHLDSANAARVHAALDAAARSGAAVLVAAHQHFTMPSGNSAANSHTSWTEPSVPGGNSAANSRRVGKPLRLRELLQRRFLAGAALGAGALLAGIALTATSGWLIAEASLQPPILSLTVAVVGVRTFGLGRAALRYVERLVTHDGAFRIAGTLRVRLWRALVRLGPARTRTLRGGEGQRRLVDDVDTVRDLLPRTVTPPLVTAIVAAGAVAVQTVILPSAGLVLLAAVVFAGIAAPALALRVERRATARLAEGRRDVGARVLAIFDGAAELLAFGTHRARRAELARSDAELAAASRRQALGAGLAEGVIVLATGLAALASTALAVSAVEQGTIDAVLAPVLALVPLALAEALGLLPPAAQHWDSLRAARLRLADTLYADPPAERARAVGDTREEDGLRGAGRIELLGDIGWPEATAPVLTDVDLRLEPGQWCGVTGPSGAGKSTLLAALLGTLPVEGGHARLPGRVAWAPQEPQLVSTTVAENLRLANPHATDVQLSDVLRLAALDLPLETRLSDAGAGLSGGQAQRLALARALLAAPDAELVLLDEPTAHLDHGTASQVLRNLRTSLAGKTVVHVTHRVEELGGTDVVAEVRDGQVALSRDNGVRDGAR